MEQSPSTEWGRSVTLQNTATALAGTKRKSCSWLFLWSTNKLILEPSVMWAHVSHSVVCLLIILHAGEKRAEELGPSRCSNERSPYISGRASTHDWSSPWILNEYKFTVLFLRRWRGSCVYSMIFHGLISTALPSRFVRQPHLRRREPFKSSLWHFCPTIFRFPTVFSWF